jgi:hypothetical protein
MLGPDRRPAGETRADITGWYRRAWAHSDGATGLLPGMDAVPERDEAGWVERRNLVEQAAIAAAGASPG